MSDFAELPHVGLPVDLAEVAVVISTYNRVEEARANIETIRCRWNADSGFAEVRIVHAHNGQLSWYAEGFDGVDVDVPVSGGSGHFIGATELLDAGAIAVAAHWRTIRYVVFLAAGTWIYDPRWIRSVLRDMARHGLRLAAASWEISPTTHGLARLVDPTLLPAAGLSTDCFVLDLPWALAAGMMPLRYASFLDTYGDLLNYWQELPLVERFMEARFLQAVRNDLTARRWGKDPWGSEGPRQARRRLRLMHERKIDPTGRNGPSHKGHWPNLGLVTDEDPRVKQRIVRDDPSLCGARLDRLRREDSTEWFTPVGQASHSAAGPGPKL